MADDTFYLENSAYTALTNIGALSADYFAVISGAGESAGLDSNDFIVYNQTDGKLYYDADGWDELEPAVQIGQLAEGLAVTSADFWVI